MQSFKTWNKGFLRMESWALGLCIIPRVNLFSQDCVHVGFIQFWKDYTKTWRFRVIFFSDCFCLLLTLFFVIDPIRQPIIGDFYIIFTLFTCLSDILFLCKWSILDQNKPHCAYLLICQYVLLFETVKSYDRLTRIMLHAHQDVMELELTSEIHSQDSLSLEWEPI